MKAFTVAGPIVSAAAFVALAQHATVIGPSVNPTAVAKRAATPPPANTDGRFRCTNGGTGSGGVLIAANAARNPRHKPAGSGFWMADLDKDECGAQAAGLWGCRFDASGKATVCGAAVIDEKLWWIRGG